MARSKKGEKFIKKLEEHQITFDEFNDLIDGLMLHGELLELWDAVPVAERIEIGESFGDVVPDEIKQKLLAGEPLI